MKKILRLFSSMKLALALLGLIVLACAAGGLIPQGGLEAQYAARFGESAARAIKAAELDRVFTA